MNFILSAAFLFAGLTSVFAAKAERPPEALDQWVVLAGSPQASERVRALEAMAALGTEAKPALPVVASLLPDTTMVERSSEPISVGRQAAITVRKLDPSFIAPPEVTQALVAQAKIPVSRKKAGAAWVVDCAAQNEALKTLGALGPAAQASLSELVRMGRKPCSRESIRATLQAFDPPAPEAAAVIIKGLEDRDAEIRQAVAEYLGSLKTPPEGSVLALGRALNDPVVNVRLASLEAIEGLHAEGEGRIPLLREFLKNPSIDVRERALAMLGRMGPSRNGLPILKEALKDTDPTVSLAAARWLAEWDPTDAELIDRLIEMAKDLDTDNGLRAAGILKSMKSSEVRVSKALAPYRDRERRRRVQEIMANTTPQEREANARGLKIQAVRMARGVVQDEPFRPASWFPDQEEPVYCWMDVSISTPPAAVRHIWSRNGKVEGEYDLGVITSRDRLWSSHKARTGRWNVELRAEGIREPLATVQFTVGTTASPARKSSTKKPR